GDLASLEAAIRPRTRLIYVESPGSLTFEMTDVPALVAIARRHGLLVAMDNTWATPLYFKPLDFGVDISIQAATKYIVGHSDVLIGTVTANARCAAQLRQAHRDFGMTTSPDDIYLALRGLRTMAVRLERQWHNGLILAEWLAARPEVEAVFHPARPEDKGHAIWKRDFSGASGLFGFVLRPFPAEKVAAFVDSLKLFGIGASWGGYESLI